MSPYTEAKLDQLLTGTPVPISDKGLGELQPCRAMCFISLSANRKSREEPWIAALDVEALKQRALSIEQTASTYARRTS